MGKAHYRGKDLTEVRSPQRQLTLNMVGSDLGKQTSLWGIANKAKASKHHRFQNLYRMLDEGMLLGCWKEMNKGAASGVDRITAKDYQKDLIDNIRELVERLKRKGYRAKLVRRSYIPKENGKERPLGIPALEDKLVQLGCAKILMAIYEQDFIEGSHGYRPRRGAREAVGEMAFNLQNGSYRYIVEADIKGFFDNIEHDWLLRMLEERIDDKAFLNLIRKWLKAGVLDTDGRVTSPETGTPQGGIISPVLANVYLHYALDLWFEKVVKKQSEGSAFICRYADDFVCGFRHEEDAVRFYAELPKRLKKFGLEIAPEKTRILRFSRYPPSREQRFDFLGFELHWCEDRKGIPRVKRRTARKKLQGACKRMKEWVRNNRHLPNRVFFEGLNKRLRGHYNYYGVRGNSQSLNTFYQWAVRTAYKWLNRRGGKRRSFTLKTFFEVVKRRGVAGPRIVEKSRRYMVYA